MIERIQRNRRLTSFALLAFLAAGCASSAPASATSFITTNPSSAGPIASIPVATTATAPSPTAAPSVPGSPPPLPDGDYVSGLETHAMAAAILTDPKIANSDSESFLAGFGTTASWTLRLASGRWQLYSVKDGQDQGVGDEGTYAFIDDHTIVLLDNSKCLNTLAFSLHAQTLQWTVLKESCGAEPLAIWKVIFQTTPWNRKP
jgi:hypothetical protein